jgi:hypothetical protein
LKRWFSQRSRYQLIQQALQQAQSDVRSLTAEHNTLEAQANAHAAAGTNAADNPSTLAEPEEHAARSANCWASTTTAFKPNGSLLRFTASGLPRCNCSIASWSI